MTTPKLPPILGDAKLAQDLEDLRTQASAAKKDFAKDARVPKALATQMGQVAAAAKVLHGLVATVKTEFKTFEQTAPPSKPKSLPPLPGMMDQAARLEQWFVEAAKVKIYSDSALLRWGTDKGIAKALEDKPVREVLLQQADLTRALRKIKLGIEEMTQLKGKTLDGRTASQVKDIWARSILPAWEVLGNASPGIIQGYVYRVEAAAAKKTKAAQILVPTGIQRKIAGSRPDKGVIEAERARLTQLSQAAASAIKQQRPVMDKLVRLQTRL